MDLLYDDAEGYERTYAITILIFGVAAAALCVLPTEIAKRVLMPLGIAIGGLCRKIFITIGTLFQQFIIGRSRKD